MEKQAKSKEPTTGEEYLQAIYFDPMRPASFSSLHKVWQEVQSEGNPFNLTRSQVQDVLEKEDTYLMYHKPKRDVFQTQHLTPPHIGYEWDSDLEDFQSLKKYNHNYAWIIVFVDHFSKFLFIRPLKKKTGEEVTNAMKDVFLHRKPKILRTD